MTDSLRPAPSSRPAARVAPPESAASSGPASATQAAASRAAWLMAVASHEVVRVGSFFLVAAVLFYWEIALPSQILADYDVWTYFYPLRTYGAQAIQSGRFPLWNPDTFLGAPFFANPQTSLLYPGSVLFYLLPVPYAYSLSVIGHVALAGLFMYLFLRRAFGVGPLGALVGGSAFAFGGFLSAQIGHLNQMSATAWMPAIALAADTALRTRSPRWAIVAALALGIQLLAGHAQESYMTLWVVAVLMAWRTMSRVGLSIQARRRDAQAARAAGLQTQPTLRSLAEHTQRVLGILAIALATGAVIGVLGFGLAAVQLLPTAELSGQSIRSGGFTYQEGIAFSLPPPQLVRALLPGYWYNPFGEYIGYVGGIALGFATLGLLCNGRWAVLGAAMLAYLGAFFAVGAANPLYPVLFDVVPGLDLFRVPARWLVVYSFGTVALAALGVDWVTGRVRTLPSAVQLTAVGIGVPILVGVSLLSVGQVPGRIVLLWLLTLALAGLLALAALRWPGRVTSVLILGLVLVDLRLAALDLPQRHAVPLDAAERPRQVPLYLTSIARPDRLLSVAPVEYEVADFAELARRYPDVNEPTMLAFKSALKLSEVMSPNVPLRYGLSTVDGYDGGVLPLRRFLDVASLLVPPTEMRSDGVLRTRLSTVPEPRFLDFFHIGVVIANRIHDLELGGIPYDVATARTLRDGDRLRIPISRPVSAQWLGMLASQYGPEPAPGSPLGRLLVSYADGTQRALPLRLDTEVFPVSRPGPTRAPAPAAETSVQLALPLGPAIAALEWQYQGPGALYVRAATLGGGPDGPQQLVLQPDLYRTIFPNLKVYEVTTVDLGVPLVPQGEVRDDGPAIDWLWAATPEERRERVMLAPGTPPAPSPGGAATFVRDEGASRPERLVFQRVQGDGGGYLVVDDAWFPGWRATVDGQEAPVYRANVHFKTVWVPPGARSVVLTFAPDSVQHGAVITLVCLLVAAVLLLRGRLW